MSDTLYIVMPAYNEESNIIRTLEDWYPIIQEYGTPESCIVVMDDGSSDNTLHLMKAWAKSHPNFIPLTHPNSGHGATLMELYAYALESGADYIFQTDTDGQTDPGQFESFWNDRHKYDMVIGWRRNRNDGISRVVVTRVLRRVVKLTFHVEVTDANTPFRLMSAESLQQNILLIPSDFNLSNVVLSAIYVKRGQRVSFREISFKPRQGGINSINVQRILGIGIKALSDFKRINREIENQITLI